MKKTLAAVSLLLALILCLGPVRAAGSDAGDPLVSLSYLEGLFRQEAEKTIGLILDSSDEAMQKTALEMLDALTKISFSVAGQNFAHIPQQITLNERDTLSGSAGLCVTAHTDNIMINIPEGTVIDATDGCEILSGSMLAVNHRYIVAENSSADFIAAAPTAILSYQGSYSLTPGESSIDYYGIALALRELGLFRGTGSGTGEGFDLHLAPTRAEALVMFIRMMGEEEDALACPYEHPFTDVPKWLDRYAAWAWHNGYSNGIGNNAFGSSLPVSAAEYQEFILRALGYSTIGVDDYRTSLVRSVMVGALTDTEYFLLCDSTFLRAHVAYLSYYSLDTQIAGTYLTLGEELQQQNVFSFPQLIRAREYVSSSRLH